MSHESHLCALNADELERLKQRPLFNNWKISQLQAMFSDARAKVYLARLRESRNVQFTDDEKKEFFGLIVSYGPRPQPSSVPRNSVIILHEI